MGMLTSEQRRQFDEMTARHPMSSERQRLLEALLAWRRYYENDLLRTTSDENDHKLAHTIDSYIDADPDDSDYSLDDLLRYLVDAARSWSGRHVKADGSHEDYIEGVDRIVVDAVNAVAEAEDVSPVRPPFRYDPRDARIANLRAGVRSLLVLLGVVSLVLLLVLFGVIPTVR